MSLVKTLAKVAVGVAVAKGVSGMMKQRHGSAYGSGGGAAGGGGGSTFGGAQSPGTAGASGGGLQDMLGQVLSGRSGQGGGLGGMLDGLSRAGRPAEAQTAAPSQGSFGDLLNQSLDSFGEPETTPDADQEKHAGLMLKAMIQAAKADGKIDAGEKAKLMEHLGEIGEEDLAFVNEQLSAPVDIDGLAGETPRGMEGEVYLMSLMAIDLDSQEEAQYLHQLASKLGLAQDDVNAIHRQLGAPELYAG